MNKPYVPNERVIDYAVEVWKGALRNPLYQASRPGVKADRALAISVAMIGAGPNNLTEEILTRFGPALKTLLMQPKPSTNDDHDDGELHYIESIGVDYDPDAVLRQAAQEAGLVMPFPVKTRMYLYATHLTFKMGYANPTTFHYPLENGKWWVTDIDGDLEGDLGQMIRSMNDNGPVDFMFVDPTQS